MTGAEMTLARYYAREVIKRELLAQGLKLSHIEASEITRAANQYIVDHPEVLALAYESYRSHVSGVKIAHLRRKKPVQDFKHLHKNQSPDR